MEQMVLQHIIGDNITILDDEANIILEDENLLSEFGVDIIVLRWNR